MSKSTKKHISQSVETYWKSKHLCIKRSLIIESLSFIDNSKWGGKAHNHLLPRSFGIWGFGVDPLVTNTTITRYRFRFDKQWRFGRSILVLTNQTIWVRNLITGRNRIPESATEFFHCPERNKKVLLSRDENLLRRNNGVPGLPEYLWTSQNEIGILVNDWRRWECHVVSFNHTSGMNNLQDQRLFSYDNSLKARVRFVGTGAE